MPPKKERPFKVLTEEEEYQAETIFDTFDKAKAGTLSTALLGDILICMDYNVNPNQLAGAQKIVDPSSSGSFTPESFKTLVASEYLYDFKFQPQPDLRRLIDCLCLFSKDGSDVKVDDVLKGLKDIGTFPFTAEVLAQMKDDMNQNSKSPGSLDLQKFSKMIV